MITQCTIANKVLLYLTAATKEYQGVRAFLGLYPVRVLNRDYLDVGIDRGR